MPDGERERGWRLLRAALRAESRPVLLGSSFGLVWTTAKTLVPVVAEQAVDNGIVQGRRGALLEWSLVLMALGIVQAVTAGLRRYQAFSIAYRVETELRQRLFAHLQRLHFAFHDRARTGQLLARSASDLQQINNLNTMIPITIANVTIVSAVTVILLVINWQLALLTLVALPMLFVVARMFAARIHPASLELQSELAEL